MSLGKPIRCKDLVVVERSGCDHCNNQLAVRVDGEWQPCPCSLSGLGKPVETRVELPTLEWPRNADG